MNLCDFSDGDRRGLPTFHKREIGRGVSPMAYLPKAFVSLGIAAQLSWRSRETTRPTLPVQRP